jgi:hypothetical protein
MHRPRNEVVRRGLMTAAAAVLVLAGGLAHGLWTDRWRPSPGIERAAEHLTRVPMELGDWVGKDLPQEGLELNRAGAAGAVVRQYENRRTGALVTVFLVCGRPGPVAVHTPDVCYGGAGYEAAHDPDRYPLPAAGSTPAAEFWTSVFSKREAARPERLRIFWSWSAPDGAWSAPSNPRVAFARSAALYKLYVISPTHSEDGPREDDPAVAFLTRFLAAWQAAAQDVPPQN